MYGGYVLGEDGFAFAETSVDVMLGLSLDLTSVFAEENSNEGLKAIWSIREGAEYITVTTDALGAMTAIEANAEGTAVLAATIGSYEVELTVNAKAREVAENEVVDFKYASDLSSANITNESDVNSIEFIEEFQGAQGVLKVEAKGWGRFGFDPLQNMSDYEGYKYLVVRMWVETNTAGAYVYIGSDFSSPDCRSKTTLQTGRWLNYYFKGETIRTQWEDLGSYYTSMAVYATGTYYIDKIYVTNEMEVIDFTHSTDLASAVNAGSAAFSYVDEFQGAQGVLKVDAASWGCLKFKAIMGGDNGYKYDNYAGAKYIVLRMYATNACNFQIANTNGGQLTELAPNAWRDIYFDAVAFMNQWTDTGNYYSSLIFKTAGTYYIDKIYMTDTVSEKLDMLDFYNESTKSYLTSGGWDITATQYYSEFQGAQGVMAITGSGGYALQCFKIMYSPDYGVIMRAIEGKSNVFAFEGLRETYDTGMQDCMLCFPLYGGVADLKIGIQKGCVIKEAKPYKYAKPIAVYGSSITQGGCASYAGSDYVGLLSQWFDFDYVNLGFSGNGKAEPNMREYLANMQASAYLLDYDYNAPNAEYLRNTHYVLYDEIRKKNPNAPIVLISKPDFDYDPESAERRDIILETYTKAREQGDCLVWFIDGEKMYGSFEKNACTVDTCHPTNLGFYRMAKYIAPVLKEVLEILGK